MWMVITYDPSMVNTEGFTSEVEVTVDLWGDGALETSHELAWAEESKCTVQERLSVPINKLFEVNLTSLLLLIYFSLLSLLALSYTLIISK